MTITERENGKLLTELLNSFYIYRERQLTIKQITEDYNSILTSNNIPIINQTTMTRWCNNQQQPKPIHYKYIIVLLQKYKPQLLESTIGRRLCKLYLESSNNDENAVTEIKYEITESLFTLLDKIPTNLNLTSGTPSLFNLLMDYYVHLIEEKEKLYLAFGHIKYEVVLPNKLRDLFFRSLKLHNRNEWLLHMVNLYFHNLYITMQRIFLNNGTLYEHKYIHKELIKKFIEILDGDNTGPINYEDYFMEISLLETDSINVKNKYFENLIHECIKLKFNADVASNCFTCYESHLSKTDKYN